VVKVIKNCVIYKYLGAFNNVWVIDEDRLSSSKLERCLQEATGFTKSRLKALMELTKDEKISLEEETKNHYIATFSCEFRTPKLIAASEAPPFVPVNFRIWLRKKSSLVVPFDAGRKLSGVAAALLSYATTGNPSSIELVKLKKEDFINLKDWILADSHSIPGQIKGITMHGVEENSVKFKKVILNSSQLEKSPLFNQLLDYASAIANMSFVTPPLESTNRPLSCRINYWGGLAIYTSNLLDSELSELIGILEKLMKEG